MRIKQIHLFIIFLLLLIFTCNLGNIEGMTNATATVVKGKKGTIVKGPNNTYVAPSNSSYYQTEGISANQIPAGQEDLYILKSQVVPPVCPACPSSSSCPRDKPCPACPACARCPEPNFTCKKVPNYKSMDTSMLPSPMLTDFSSF